MRAIAFSPSDGDQDLASEWSEGDSAEAAGMQVRSRGRLVRLSTLVVVAVGGTVLAFHQRGQLRAALVQRKNPFEVLVEEQENEQVTIEITPSDVLEQAERRPGKWCSNWEAITVQHPAVTKDSVEDCAAECLSFPGCTGFQYQGGACDDPRNGSQTEHQKGTCHVWKGACVEVENSCVENFQVVPFTFALWAADAARQTCGNTAAFIRQENAFNQNVCGQMCAEDDLCDIFAYSGNYSGDGQCALFQGPMDVCRPTDDEEWDLYVMDRVNDIVHEQAKRATESDEASEARHRER